MQFCNSGISFYNIKLKKSPNGFRCRNIASFLERGDRLVSYLNTFYFKYYSIRSLTDIPKQILHSTNFLQCIIQRWNDIETFMIVSDNTKKSLRCPQFPSRLIYLQSNNSRNQSVRLPGDVFFSIWSRNFLHLFQFLKQMGPEHFSDNSHPSHRQKNYWTVHIADECYAWRWLLLIQSHRLKEGPHSRFRREL